MGARESAPKATRGAAWRAWRLLMRMQLAESPLRTASTLLAVALGVALGVAVYLVDAAALAQFDRATRHVVGRADLTVRAGAGGFDQQLFVRLARNPAVAAASPLLQLTVPLAPGPATGAATFSSERGRPVRSFAERTLPILALDAFRAAPMQPALVGALDADITRLFRPDSIVLSASAAQRLGLGRGATLPILSGAAVHRLRVIDVLPTDATAGDLGIMDLGSAQWVLGQLGRLNRIDLQLKAGVDAARFRRQLAASLPAGAVIETPAIENGRAAAATRAYRVNLNMLALVALLTGAFLVFATQSLAVLRRRVALGLLRCLGLTRAELQRALLGEGIAIGVAGSVLGLALGALLAWGMLAALGADLGNRQLEALDAAFALRPGPLAAFALLGTAAAALGALLPAIEASRRAPSAALKAGDVEPVLQRLPGSRLGLVLLIAGGATAWLPPVHGIPVAGYGAVAALLLGAVLLVPALVRLAAAAVPRTGGVVLDASVAQLRGSAGTAAVSLAAVMVSFSLMVAMAIMVHSFRDSFEVWLVELLPADVQLSLPADTIAALSPAQQARIAALPGVAQVRYRRERTLYLRSGRPPVTLIARELPASGAGTALPLLQTAARPAPDGAQRAWISGALRDLYGLRPGEWLDLPLAGRQRRFFIAGVWRDYVHPQGAVVISRRDYVADTGDRAATEASVWQRPGADTAATEAALRRLLPGEGAFDMTPSTQLRQRSLAAFDRAFWVTYALEAAAVLIGLAGISMAASATALARRGQFGMLRHIGLLRRQVLGMLACEGIGQSTLAVACGLALGGALSLILIYVINRQSFHWSIDLSIPWGELLALSVALIAAAALTALASGRAALGKDVIRAVREDW